MVQQYAKTLLIDIDNEITLWHSPIEKEIEFIVAVCEILDVVVHPFRNAENVSATAEFNAGPEERLKFW